MVVDKNPRNGFGFTPLHHAACHGHFNICKLIIENVEYKNPASDTGLTPLHYAALNGHYTICKLIIDCVADKNPADHNGKTPLDLRELAPANTVPCRIWCECQSGPVQRRTAPLPVNSHFI